MTWGPNIVAGLLTFVLAAKVGKESYGLVGVALLYISFLQIFLESGLGAAIVQRKNLEPEHLDAVFWITLVFSLTLTAITWVVGPLLENLYVHTLHHPDMAGLSNVLRLESLVLPLQGLTVVQESLLEKKLDFKSLAVRSNVSTMFGGLFGLILAFTGYGVWALVWEDLLAAFARVVLLWRLGDWRPKLRLSVRHIKDLFSFSLYVLLGQIGTFVQRRCDALLVAGFFGPAAVGIYQMADRLINLVIEMATRPFILVVMPHFSQMQDNLVELRKAVLNCLRTASMLTVPLLGILAGCAVLICQVLSALKKDWMPAVPVIQILALAGAARAITLMTGPLLQSVNRPKLFMSLSWALAVLNVIAFSATGFWLSEHPDIRWQAVGVASTRVIVFCGIYTPICLYTIMKVCQIDVGRVLKAIAPSILSGLFVAAVGWGLTLLIGLSNPLVESIKPVWLFRLGQLGVGGTITTVSAFALMVLVEPSVREVLVNRFNKKKKPTRVIESDPDVNMATLEKPVAESAA